MDLYKYQDFFGLTIEQILKNEENVIKLKNKKLRNRKIKKLKIKNINKFFRKFKSSNKYKDKDDKIFKITCFALSFNGSISK